MGAVFALLAGCSANGATSSPGQPTSSGGSFGDTGGSSYVASGGAYQQASGGTTSTVGTGGAAAGTGGAHDSTLFAWPEANADGGTSSLCKAGHYLGTYSCDVYGPNQSLDAGSAPVIHLDGPIDLVLAEAQTGEFLSVSGGTLKSNAAGFTLNATLMGTLNCQTGAFSGVVQNGEISISPFPPGATFDGSLQAVFKETGPALDGTWSLIGGGVFAGFTCKGPWNAPWQAN